MIRCPCLCMD